MKSRILQILSVFALTHSLTANDIEIRDLSVQGADISFSFTEPDNEYLIASTFNFQDWSLDNISTSNQSERVFSTPLSTIGSRCGGFMVCELSTTDKVHSGNFSFLFTVTSAEDGQFYETDDQTASLQATSVASVGESESLDLTASVDLNDLTIDFLGLTGALTPSGLGYEFELRIDFPIELVEEASSEVVQFYVENSEVFSGRYDLCTGQLVGTLTETSRLSWNRSSDISISTTVSSLVSSND